MSEENKNSITTRSILTAVNKLSTLQFLLEKLKLEYRLEQKITDRHSLTFRDIVFFEYTKKSDIVDYIIEKNKEKLSEQKKEYREAHKEEAAKANKEWREANKEKLKNKRAEIINCECGNQYTFGNKRRHLQSKVHINYQNENLQNAAL